MHAAAALGDVVAVRRMLAESSVLPDEAFRGAGPGSSKAHRARLLAILAPKFPHLPKEMVSVVIDFWAHVGFY